MKHVLGLMLGLVIGAHCAVAGDKAAPREIPATIEPEFRPVPEVEYRLAAGTLYHPAPGGGAGPAEQATSIAWALANEFVYRTALAKEYVVPAAQAGPVKGGWFRVGFTSKDGKSRLTVEVQVARRVARLRPPEGAANRQSGGCRMGTSAKPWCRV